MNDKPLPIPRVPRTEPDLPWAKQDQSTQEMQPVQVDPSEQLTQISRPQRPSYQEIIEDTQIAPSDQQ